MDSKVGTGASLLWNCTMPITNTKGSYLYPCSNTTPSRPRLQHLLPKTNNMMSCWSRVHHQSASFFISGPRHHALPNVSTSSCGKSSFAEWWHTPDRIRLYRMRWRKFFAEWYSFAKFGPHVSLFLDQFLVLTYAPFNYGIKDDFNPELTINAQRSQAESVQHPFFPPSNRWSCHLDPNPSSSIFQASTFKWWTKTRLFR
jgi:hypothetical protein